jgi:hypothetical protein
LKSSLGRTPKVFGWIQSHSTEGFSLLELSVSIFFTSLLCSFVLYTAIVVWHTEFLSTNLAEQSGMTLNIERVLTEDIDRAMAANFNGGTLQLTMVDGVQHRLTVNSNHQLILNLQNGGTTVVADSVLSLIATTDSRIVKVQVNFVSGANIVVVADLLGGLVS